MDREQRTYVAQIEREYKEKAELKRRLEDPKQKNDTSPRSLVG